VVLPAKGASDFENLRQMRAAIERIVDQSGYGRVDPLLQIDVGGDGVNKIREYDATIQDIFGTLWIPILGIILLILVYFRRLVGLLLAMIPLGMSICWTAALTTLLIGTLNYVTGFLFAVLTGWASITASSFSAATAKGAALVFHPKSRWTMSSSTRAAPP